MLTIGRVLSVIGAGAALCVAHAAPAQESGNVIGPPQLRDFSLEPQNRIVTQPDPAPAPAPPVRVAPPPPVTATEPPAATQRPAPSPAQPRAATPQPARPAPAPAAPPPVADLPAEAPSVPEAGPDLAPAPAAPTPEAVEESAAPVEETGIPYWLYAIPALLLVLVGAALLRRRRAGAAEEIEPEAASAPAAAASSPSPLKPRPEPGMRPWLELELKTERASFTDAEASINFELEIRNSGKSPAKNLRIDVKLFNGSEQQDKEIGAFFRTAGRETTRLNLPGIAPGQSGVIRGEVGMPRDQMRALRLDDRMLFIPVIAVNALYDCDDGRTGQSSKSYVVGRELQAEDARMGAFRVDQGPRVWRTVGQRPHKLARRV